MAKKGEKINYQFDPYRKEVMKALCLTKLSGRDFRVLLFILGQTDGYHRTEDKIKPAFFAERTGLDKSNIRVTLARLRKLNMIIKHGHFYAVLPPDKWDKEVFVETPMRIDIDALLAEVTGEKRIESDAEVPPPGEEKRIESDAPSALNPMHQELRSDAVLASSKEHPSKEHPSKEYKDNLMKEISALYSENIGVIKPALAEEMREFCESFSGPVSWVKPAFREALSRNKKSWNYIRTILENWEEKGGPDDGERGRPGGDRRHARPARPVQPRRHPITYISGSGKAGQQ